MWMSWMCALGLVVLLVTINCVGALDVLSCYFEKNHPRIEDIDPQLCTHLILIGGCVIDSECRLVLPPAEDVVAMNKLKKKNGELKTLFSLLPGNNQCMSKIVTNTNLTSDLVKTITDFIISNALDGFDVDWEFPSWGHGSKPTDKKGLRVLLGELRKSFDATDKPLLLTIAVAAPYTIVKAAYDIDALNRYVDFVQIMHYDYHIYSKSQSFTAFNAPLFKKLIEIGPLGKLNSNYSTYYWLQSGLWRNKTVFGIPTYGRGMTLLNKHLHFVYAPAIRVSTLGAFIAYTDICPLIGTDNYKYVYDKETRSPYLYGGDKQWYSFEDRTSVREKAIYAIDSQLKGIFAFDLGNDDVKGVCGQGTYPLIREIKSIFDWSRGDSSNISSIPQQ